MASSGNWFDQAYRGIPPWDIGRPQPGIVRLAQRGEIRGRVLDIGCGTGENTLFLAGRGLEVVGIDAAPTAIGKARAKTKERGITARFEVADALNLPAAADPFDSVIDMGLFHVFPDEARERYRESLARVLRPSGTYFMMCFSDRQPGDWGPRRITQTEIRSTFAEGWRINYIQPTELEMTEGRAFGWLASIAREPAGATQKRL
jgi:SAM-dependent methyltransferase